MNNWGFLGRYWERLPYRKRCTCHALLAVTSTPYVVLEGRLVFHSMVTHAWYTGMLALMGLWAIYYMVARAWIDLLTDIIDVSRGTYSLLGEVNELSGCRTNNYPYDLYSSADVKRDWTNWQYLLACWSLIEATLIPMVASIALLYTVFNSPYMQELLDKGDPHSILDRVKSFMIFCDYMVGLFGVFSMTGRDQGGITPLHLRLLGLPNVYPDQNNLPRWLNELMIRLTGRPL